MALHGKVAANGVKVMPEDVQARVGHVLVVGGRAVRVPPPGALAELAPRHAPRAREGHAFVILVTPHGESRAPALYFETLAQLGADTYFGSSGGITGGLREALAAINRHILDDPAGEPVNALALVLHGDDLYVARAGRSFMVWRGAGGLTFFPEERRDPLVINLSPLGSGDPPDIQLTRLAVAPGDMLLLCDESLQHAPTTIFDIVLGEGTLAEVLGRLKTLSSKHLAVSAVAFVPPGAPDAERYALQHSLREPRKPQPAISPASGSKVDWGQDALRESPLVREETAPDERDVEAKPAPSPAESPLVETFPAEMLALADEVPAPVGAALPPLDIPPVREAEVLAVPPIPASETPSPVPVRADVPGNATTGGRAARLRATLGGVAGRFSGGPDADGVEPPPLPLPPVAAGRKPKAKRSLYDGLLDAESVPWRAMQRQASLALRQGLRAVLVAALAGVDFLSAALNRLVPEPEEGRRSAIPTNIAIGLAVMIPVVIVVAAVGMALLGAEKSEFQKYMERAQAAHADALRLSGGSCENPALRPLWVEVLDLAERAEVLRPNDPNVLTIRADAENYLDCFDDVVRRDLTLLRTYPRDAEMASPVVHGGVDLYALDRRNGVVYHNTLNERGDGLTDSGDTRVIWTGQTISGATGNFTVGRLIDIEWLADGGTRPKNVLVALDANGLLIAYSPTYFTSAQTLVTEGRWQEPTALAVFRSNLYVMDPPANQIWRYVPPAGAESYPNAPEEYFNGDQLPNLAGAVDFGISDDGAVYILFADGTVRRYRRNVQGIVEEEPFEFRQAPPGAISSGAALFVDNDPASRNLYIVDGTNETVYETSWAGTFNQGYRPRNPHDAFQDARGFYADSVARNNMYLLAGNRLYHFKRFP